MDAKRTPVAEVSRPAAAAAGAVDRAPREHSWLVFRLGPHTMCASTLDVEGIIEPAPTTPLPFTPAHVLGTFMFRGQVATAISLRRKLAVPVGEDSPQGPFVVARVGEELAAFWVDEVIEVMGEQGVVWQPMPDMLRGRVFDQYAIVRDELILHTCFAWLLEADSESIPARWRAAPENSATDALTPTEPPSAGAATDGDASRDDSRAHHEAETAAAERAGPRPDGAAERDESRSSGGTGAAADQTRAPRIRPDEGPVPPRTRANVVGMTGRPTARQAPETGRHRPTPAHEPTFVRRDVPPGRSGTAAGDASRIAASPTASSTTGRWPLPPRPAQAAGHRGGDEGRGRMIQSVAADEARPRAHEFGHASRSTGRETRPEAGRGRSRARALGGAVLALCAILIALVALWPDSQAPSPSPDGAAEHRAPGPVVAEPMRRQPAVDQGKRTDRSPQPPPAERIAEAPASATPGESQRVATLESETLHVTIDRPHKPAAKAAVTLDSGASSAVPSAGQANATTGVVHVVVRGDTLWDISRKYLGNPFRYPELVRLSGIKNPDLIHPGDIVRIRVSEQRR